MIKRDIFLHHFFSLSLSLSLSPSTFFPSSLSPFSISLAQFGFLSSFYLFNNILLFQLSSLLHIVSLFISLFIPFQILGSAICTERTAKLAFYSHDSYRFINTVLSTLSYQLTKTADMIDKMAPSHKRHRECHYRHTFLNGKRLAQFYKF